MRFVGLVTALVGLMPRPTLGQEPRLDLYGDSLPAGAVARIGTVRLRNVTEISRIALTPDGKLLVTSGDHTPLQVWDTATGAFVRQLRFPPLEKIDRLRPEVTQEGLSTFNFGPAARKLYAVTASGRVLTCDVTTGEWGPVLARAEKGPDFGHLTWASRTGDGTRFFYQPSMGWDHRIPVVVLSAEHPRPTHTLSLVKYSRPRALTADARFLVAVDGDRAVSLWDLTTDELVLCRRAPAGRMFDATVSPDGKMVVAVCGPKHVPYHGATAPPGTTVYAWDAATGKELYRNPWEGHFVNFSPDGSRLISLLGREVLVGDARTGRLVHRLQGHGGWGIVSYSFTTDCTRLATGGHDHAAIVWDLASGKAVLDFDSPRGPVSVVAVSPDGRTVLTGCTGDSTVGLWDAATGRRRHQLSTNDRGGTLSAAFTPDGRHIVVGHGTNGRNTGLAWSARLWSVADGKLVREFGGHTDGVGRLAVSADGKQLATRDGGGKVRVWELETGRRTHELEWGSANEPFAMTFPRAGELIGVSSTRARETEVRNLLAGTPVGKWTTPDRANGNVLSPDGRLVLVYGSDYESRLTLRETATGKVVRTFGSHSPSGVRVIAFSPDGHSFALTGFEGRHSVALFEAATGREVGTVTGHTGWVCGIAFSPDGRRLVTGSWDSTALVWDRPGRP